MVTLHHMYQAFMLSLRADTWTTDLWGSSQSLPCHVFSAWDMLGLVANFFRRGTVGKAMTGGKPSHHPLLMAVNPTDGSWLIPSKKRHGMDEWSPTWYPTYQKQSHVGRIPPTIASKWSEPMKNHKLGITTHVIPVDVRLYLHTAFGHFGMISSFLFF